VFDESFTLPAYAKINLTLQVLGRRADNYHEIRTVFQTISLRDQLTFRPLAEERFEFVCSAPGLPTDERNLVHRAAMALRERYGIREGAHVELEKNIPAAGGLGGGSSDAAIALLGLSYLWKIKPDRSELAEIGARLGADVPFFLTGGTALGTGLGTDIFPLGEVPRKHLLVITPGVKVSTAEAYKALNSPTLTKPEGAVILPISCAQAQISASFSEDMHNDFELIIFKLRPEIERARNKLIEAGARKAMLAGSGSSVFGVFDGVTGADRAFNALNGEVGWQVFRCTTLSRGEYREALGKYPMF